MIRTLNIRILVVLFFFVFVIECSNDLPTREKESFRIITNTEELLIANHVKYETKEIVTNNYTLTVFHIIALVELERNPRPLVYFQHGVMTSSSSWLLYGQNNSLPLILDDNGYDVWIGNTRGNFYGNRHEELSPSQYEFWNYGLDDMASDVRSILDKIIEITENKQVFYVGHSMGTTLFYIYCSTNPEECNSKIKGMVSLAPVAYFSHLYAPIKLFTRYAHILNKFLKLTLKGKMLPTNMIKFLVGSKKTYEKIKTKMINAVLCIVPKMKRVKLLMLKTRGMLDCTPINDSANTFLHFAQISIAGKFRRFDYGKKGNKKAYGNEKPPEYDLKVIKVPTALFYSKKDIFSSIQDVAKLRERLLSVVVDHEIEDGRFAHEDFLFGRNVKTVLYNYVFDFIVKLEDGLFANRLFGEGVNLIDSQSCQTGIYKDSIEDSEIQDDNNIENFTKQNYDPFTVIDEQIHE